MCKKGVLTFLAWERGSRLGKEAVHGIRFPLGHRLSVARYISCRFAHDETFAGGRIPIQSISHDYGRRDGWSAYSLGDSSQVSC